MYVLIAVSLVLSACSTLKVENDCEYTRTVTSAYMCKAGTIDHTKIIAPVDY